MLVLYYCQTTVSSNANSKLQIASKFLNSDSSLFSASHQAK